MGNVLRLPFEGPIKGFAVNYIRKNAWRLKGHVSMEDALADAYEIYAKCLDRYGGIVDTPEWFMALFKRAFINHFHAVSKYTTFLDSFCDVQDLIDEDADLQAFIGTDKNLGELLIKIQQAPEDVVKVVEFLLNASSEYKAYEDSWREQGKKKVGGNEYLCRALGYNPRKVDLISMVYDYFIDDVGGS